MALEIMYEKKEDIPEAHVELFTEKDEKWHLTGITGLVTKDDVDKLNTALGKERTDHKATKKKVSLWGELEHEQVTKDLNELTELRAANEAGEGGKDAKANFEAKVNAAAEARITAANVKADRELSESKKINDEQATQIVGFESANTVRTIGDSVRKAAVSAKIIDTAMDDVLMLSERIFEINEEGLVLVKDQVGYTPGIAADVWLSEMQEKRPHWWPTSEGGGSKGGKGATGFINNPWTLEHWNLTNQAKAVREDRGKAERMAKAAGSSFGGMKPLAKAKI